MPGPELLAELGLFVLTPEQFVEACCDTAAIEELQSGVCRYPGCTKVPSIFRRDTQYVYALSNLMQACGEHEALDNEDMAERCAELRSSQRAY